MEDNYLETVYNNELLNFMVNNNILRCNFLNSKKNNCHFLELSSGEKLFLNVLTNFAYTLFRLPDDYCGVMLFDEIELSFHPNWQKRLLNSFIYIQDKISKSKLLHLHLIFTSHSPFILSDLPKENVIFLRNGKQDNPDIEQTFGANIHTLLSHGFFMDGGLMGEFAKGKINDILNFYKQIDNIKENKAEVEKLKIVYLQEDNHKQTLKDKMWNIQSIIGDDYLKQVIKNHLVEIEKILLGNDEAKKLEIERLQNQIKLLEKENASS